MKPKNISQREARANRKELHELKEMERHRRSRYRMDYPGGTNIATLGLLESHKQRLDVAQILGHALVCKFDGEYLRVFAL